MLDELHGPFVAHVVKEATNVRIQDPVHSLPLDAHRQGFERLMRAGINPNGFGSINITSSVFGQITSFRAPRMIQIAAKLTF
jgi:hypothetical protein